MDRLAFCWLIIERIIIPDGFLKWFYLSFYIHPIFLCFCQIFLWIKSLQRWCFLLILLLYRFILFVSSCCITTLRFFASFFRSNTKVLDEGMVDNQLPNTTSNQNQLVIYAATAPGYNTFDVVQTYYKVGSMVKVEETVVLQETGTISIDEIPSFIKSADNSCDSSSIISSSSSAIELELLNPGAEISICSAEDLDACHPCSNLSSMEQDSNSNQHSPPIFHSHLPAETDLSFRTMEEESESIYAQYKERMKWFDVLCHDRLHGIDAILNKNSTSICKKAREKLIRSLRSDFELVYVAQSCLSWDALLLQYRKIEAIANSGQNRVLHKNTADRFQELQILLERFLEDEHIGSQRHLHYVHTRFSFKKLLQVPHVSENDTSDGEVMNVKATQVLKIIEKCIKVFWLFVSADAKKPTWKLRNILRSNSPVEDPRDLELLYDLRETLRKKELLLKKLEGKRNCCWKKAVNPRVRMEYEIEDFLFTTMDLKLVRKVLHMSTISTSHLKWCLKKLNNIEIIRGQFSKTQQIHLFPSCGAEQ